MDPLFLTYDEVVAINEDQVRRYGGLSGVRDEGLLLSALAMPQAGFGDQYAHADLYEMAAAYLFHLVKNHAFVDGNKRVGAVAARIFLALNGIAISIPEDALYDLVIATAESRATKAEIAAAFRSALTEP
ncbi:MAG: type II toxin-antitoxin system death-on-curing family toxin [Coriobacteriia bacterium]